MTFGLLEVTQSNIIGDYMRNNFKVGHTMVKNHQVYVFDRNQLMPSNVQNILKKLENEINSLKSVPKSYPLAFMIVGKTETFTIPE